MAATFKDPELERRVDQLIGWVEDHIDEIEDRIKDSGLPTISKLIFSPAILFRRRIYKELRQLLAKTTLEDIRRMMHDVAAQERRMWEAIEVALEEPDWINVLEHSGMLALTRGGDSDETETEDAGGSEILIRAEESKG